MVNLLKLETDERFESFCKALLTEHYVRFQPFSAPDSGVDGYDEGTETVFQLYFPERAPRKDKIVRDIQKILNSPIRPKQWVLIIPKDPSPAQKVWVETGLKNSLIRRDIWGTTKIDQLLRAYPKVREEFFPTEIRRELRRLAKGKKPCAGDADGLRQYLAMRAKSSDNSSPVLRKKPQLESAVSLCPPTTAGSMPNSKATSNFPPMIV